MKKPVIRAIFVDFGNVCATFDFHRFIRNFSHAVEVSPANVEAVLCDWAGLGGYSPLFASFECGLLSPEQFFRALTALLNCRERIDFETFARLWVDIFDEENAALNELLHQLPQQKYLLSNTNKIVHGRHIAECRIVRNHFPSQGCRILSYRIGVIKPSSAVYHAALKRAGSSAKESLFIDDARENIDAWRALGGIGIVYHAGKNSIQELESELRILGVLTP